MNRGFVNNDVILSNPVASDADGARESKHIFVGRQSGDEQSALAEIKASHDGASDDEKGKLEEYTNDGSDGFSPTLRRTVDSAGNHKIGDGGVTNYTNIASDGTITLVGTARVTKQILLLAPSGKKAGVNDPTSALVGEFPVEQFSQAVTQNLYWTTHIPKDWDPSTDMLVHIHWAPVNANAGDVVWDIDYSAIATGQLLTAAATALTVTDSTQTTQDQSLETASMTMVAGNIALDDMLSIHVSRDTGDGNDTYGSAASFICVEISYTVNSLGESL